MAETIYVRNLRPNRVIIKYADLHEVLERRGSREDSVGLPADALNDSIIARWLQAGMIEQISKEEYLSLTASLQAYDPHRRSDDEPALKRTSKERDLPITKVNDEGARTPTVVDTDKIDRNKLSPVIEYVNPIQPKADVSDNLAPQEVDIQDLHRGATGRPEQLTNRERAEFEAQLAEAKAELARLQADRAEPDKPTPTKAATRKTTTTRKRATTTRKSTKS